MATTAFNQKQYQTIEAIVALRGRWLFWCEKMYTQLIANEVVTECVIAAVLKVMDTLHRCFENERRRWMATVQSIQSNVK